MRKSVIACLIGILVSAFTGKETLAAKMEYPVPLSPRSVHPLGVGDSVPNGNLTTLAGKKVSLQTLIVQKPSVLIFYRGGWCPYCNLQMGQLVKIEPELVKMGYQLLAITPDKPESLRESLEKHRINYTLLSDRTMGLSRPEK